MSNQQTSDGVVQSAPIIVDPSKDIPVGLAGTIYDIDLSQPPYNPQLGSVPVVSVSGTGTTTLAPPANISILSQTIRFTPTGTHVVDVILTFDDVPGAVNYDVRITKTS